MRSRVGLNFGGAFIVVVAAWVAGCSGTGSQMPQVAPQPPAFATKPLVARETLPIYVGSSTTVDVVMKHYHGKLHSVAGRRPCSGITTWQPHRGTGPKLVVKIEALGVGNCAIGFSNVTGSRITWVPVSVMATPSPTPSPLPTLKITYFPFPASSSGGHNAEGLTAGPDGNIWFTVDPFAVGRMTTAGSVTLFQKGIPISSSIGTIAAGADKNLWFTEIRGEVGRITTAGAVTFFTPSPPPHPGFAPTGITAGPSDDLYFIAEPNLYTVTTSGTIGGVSVPACPYAQGSDALGGVAAGPNNSVWVTTYSGCVIEIGYPGVVSKIHSNVQVGLIVKGSDGNMWFTTKENTLIGKVTTSGVPTTYQSGLNPYGEYEGFAGITAGPDGNIWFAGSDVPDGTNVRHLIGRVTTAGVVTTYQVPRLTGGIITGPDGHLWFAAGGTLGRFSPP